MRRHDFGLNPGRPSTMGSCRSIPPIPNTVPQCPVLPLPKSKTQSCVSLGFWSTCPSHVGRLSVGDPETGIEEVPTDLERLPGEVQR